MGAIGMRKQKTLQITVPAGTDPAEQFDDVLCIFAKRHTLRQTQMQGSDNVLHYHIQLHKGADLDDLLEELRIRSSSVCFETTS